MFVGVQYKSRANKSLDLLMLVNLGTKNMLLYCGWGPIRVPRSHVSISVLRRALSINMSTASRYVDPSKRRIVVLHLASSTATHS